MVNLQAYSISSNNKKESSKLLRNKLDFLKIIISAVIRLIKVSNKLIYLSLERLICAKLTFIQQIYSSDYLFYCYSFEEDMFHFILVLAVEIKGLHFFDCFKNYNC